MYKRQVHSIHEFNNALSDDASKSARNEHSEYELNQLKNGGSNSTLNAPLNSLANSLEECRRITRPGTAIYLISDFHDFDQDAAKALRNLGKHSDLTLLQVGDKLEQELPNLGAVSLSNGNETGRFNLSKSLTRAYHEYANNQQNLLISSATKARAHYASIDTSQTAKAALIALFAK